MSLKEEFIEIFSQNIRRPGASEFLSWLENTDFFAAPASTKYHCACRSGLVLHSLNVYKVLIEKHFDAEKDNPESYAIAGLLHDICKTNFYKPGTRNVKNEETGFWEAVPIFLVEDTFPYGHGEKSVFLIERFMRLKLEEAMAIRWHMGGFDDTAKSGGFSMSIAFDKYPLAVKLHMSDLEATYLREKQTSDVRRDKIGIK